jgi:hypothetical protein
MLALPAEAIDVHRKPKRARRKMAGLHVSLRQLDETGQLPLLKRLQPRSFSQSLPKRYSQDPAAIRLAGWTVPTPWLEPLVTHS